MEKGGAPGNTSSEGRVWVDRAMVRWRNELGPTVLNDVGVAAVAGSDEEDSLQHRAVKGGGENGGPR
jgi:hypothetical protein